MQLLEPIKQRKPRGDIAISKLKIKDKDDDFSIEIIYDLPPETSETKTIKFKCQERPAPGFWEALASLLKWTISKSGLIAEVWATASVPEINFKDTEEGLDVAIALKLEVEDRAINLKLNQKNISFDLQNKVDELVFEIENYIGGDRSYGKQMQLFEQ